MKAAWWIVFTRELRDLWIGGKALYLILIYTVLLGGYAFSLASNVEIQLLPRKEMILEMVKAGIAVSLLISMVIAADSISGERERRTLEGLLLTPATRRQIVFGKLLAAVSPWPVALAISVPYWAVLAKGDPVFGPALIWSLVLGGALVPAVAAVGLLVSILCNTTKASMLVCLGLYLPMLMAAEIFRPGKVMTSAEAKKGIALQAVNPLAAVHGFLSQTLVFDVPLGQVAAMLVPLAVFVAVALVLVFGFASPHLSLEAGTATRLRSFLATLGMGTRPAVKVQPRPAVAAPAETFPTPATPTRAHTPLAMRRHPVDASSGSAPWWLVFKKELRDLWVGGRALNLTIAYTVLLGGYAYWMARDSGVSLIPPKEMVFELLKAELLAGVFMGLIIGADSLSGERERATLEGLLLTPTSRRQLVVAKFLAACSTWPVALVVTIPYFKVLSQGDEVFGQAVLWGSAFGTVLTPAFTALGMLVSARSNSNKTSMFVSLALFLLFVLPTQLPGNAQGGFIGLLGQQVNPLGAYRFFLAKILVNNATPEQVWLYAVAPPLFGVLMVGLLVLYAAPALSLEAATPRKRRLAPARVAAAVGIASLFGVFGAAPTRAQEAVTAAPLKISISMTDSTVRAGGTILFQTVVTNDHAQLSHPVIVAMNIINLNAEGEVVDPEDWSPQRTQYIEPLAPGQSTSLDWRVNAILDGDYMVYMVAIPAPGSADATSQPVASAGIHLTVTPYTKLNPGGVLPFAIGGPVVLGLLILFVYRHRRKQIDAGGSA
ncbi:MAG TPA: ABC transporter permease subunit [Gemmatimonadales bacterium]|jgi:ABC-2 type transport system permease protein|nr:ABC transporter permease subunit [Gemmatimonadales bacterium]